MPGWKQAQGDPMEQSNTGRMNTNRMSPAPQAGGMGSMGTNRGMGTNRNPGNPPMQATPSFAQRKANAQSLYGPGGSGWAQNFAQTPTGGGPQDQSPMQPPTRPMEPPPVFQVPRDQAGGAGLWGPKPFPGGPGQFGPPQQAGNMGGGPGREQPPPFAPNGPRDAQPFSPVGGQENMLRQLFSQPGFMQMLQQYMTQQRQPQVKEPAMGGTGPYNPGFQQF